MPESLLGKSWQDESCPVYLPVVVSAQLFLLLWFPMSQGLSQISLGILAAHHETDLAAGVCRNSGEGIFNDREDLVAVCLEGFDEIQMQPLILA